MGIFIFSFFKKQTARSCSLRPLLLMSLISHHVEVRLLETPKMGAILSVLSKKSDSVISACPAYNGCTAHAPGDGRQVVDAQERSQGAQRFVFRAAVAARRLP